MLSMNVSCAVCKIVFKSSDTIYSTNCGHVFHFSCISRWNSEYNSCPQCRSYRPTTHAIYLNFDNGAEYQKIVNDLNTKLESFKEELNKIAKENKKLDGIKRLYNISEQWRAELEDKIIKISRENEVQKANHAKELNVKIEEIQSVKTHMEILEKEKGIQSLFSKINEFSAENMNLQKKLRESEAANIILKHKIEMQEQRLKYFTSELQKQFDKNPKLKIKQESSEKNMPQQKQIKRNIGSNHKNFKMKSFEDLKNISVGKLNTSDVTVKTLDANCTLRQTRENKQFELTHPNDTKVIIKDFCRDNIITPLKNTVVLLAAKMSINLVAEDILGVEIVDPKNISRLTNKVGLLVEFKSINEKIKFMTHRNRLKHCPSTKLLKIKEYIDETVYPIFMYANRALRANGRYESIYCKDNKIFAKKKLNDTEEIVIKDKHHVDLLLSNYYIEEMNRKRATAISRSLYDISFI